jgi:hypothetical protein
MRHFDQDRDILTKSNKKEENRGKQDKHDLESQQIAAT